MGSQHRISLNIMDGSGTFNSIVNPLNDSDFIQRLGQYLASFADGNNQGKLRLNAGAAQASGTVTFASFVDADTVTVNGVVLTGKNSPSGAAQFGIGASDEATANNLAAKINASVTNKIVGCLYATRRGTVSVSGMVDGDTVTINAVIFTAKNTPADGNQQHFKVGTTDSATAANLNAAINQSLRPEMAGVVATVSTTTVTVNTTTSASLTMANSAHGTIADTVVVLTCPIPGQIGNLCTLAISAHGSVSAANMAGGTEGTETIFTKNYSAV